jgi:hypothetical protein
MNVNQSVSHHLRVAQANIQPIRPSLTHSTHDIHSSRSRNVRAASLGQSVAAQSSATVTSSGTVNQSGNTSTADKYISAVRDRLDQANPNAAHRFDET